MIQAVSSTHSFNESQWMKLVFLLADTQSWIDEMSKDLFAAVPVSKVFEENIFLNANCTGSYS